MVLAVFLSFALISLAVWRSVVEDVRHHNPWHTNPKSFILKPLPNRIIRVYFVRINLNRGYFRSDLAIGQIGIRNAHQKDHFSTSEVERKKSEAL